LDLSCVVLAGGRGSRLGRDKAKIIVGRKSLFQRVLDSISFLDSEVIVVTSEEESCPWLASYPGHKVVTDIYTSRGPLGGIFTGLTVSRSLYNLVIACDMPFLNQALLSYMLEIAAGFDLVMPRLGNMVEPLHAVYSKDCLVPIEQMIKQDELSINRLLDLVNVRYVDSEEISRFDPEHLSFFNVNTEAELETARALVSRGEKNDNG
jgi:molybdopterin-guanine dinucleotide biosynthesis protein A